MGRVVRLFAATAALMFLGISGAAAGWYGSGYGNGGYGYGKAVTAGAVAARRRCR